MKGAYSDSLREEELKNKVARDWFAAFDTTRIIGDVDFCVDIPATELALGYEAEPALWAEAKAGTRHDIVASFVQLIITIGKAKTAESHLPPLFLGAFDAEKIAFVSYAAIMDVFTQNDFNWKVAPSDHESREFKSLYARIEGLVRRENVLFRYEADAAELRRFIKANFKSSRRDVSKILINKNNFTHIYRRWREAVMPHINAPWDVLKRNYGIYDRDFYLAEMNIDDSGTSDISDDRVADKDFYISFDAKSATPYAIRRKNEDDLFNVLAFGFRTGGLDAYAEFWRRYKRPPKKEYWNFIKNRLDLLVPQDVRERKGSFFTPAIWVEKSQQYLAAVLGENWQDEYYVWDCCAGTGNLEAGLVNKYRVWASTLDQQDVDVMRDRIKGGANLLDSHVFQFDFLNDSFDKLPKGLSEIIDDPEKRRKLVIYINPPYAEVSSKVSFDGGPKGKRGVNVTEVQKKYSDMLGTASRELFAQFLMRIAKEIPGCAVGQFSKTKHLQGAAFATFRQVFRGTLEKCFLVPADTFDNVKGKFPIGFFVWRMADPDAEEKKRREIRKFLEGEPVACLTGHEFEGIKGREALIDAIHESFSRVKWQISNDSIGLVRLDKSGVRDSIYHGFGRVKLSAFAALPELIANGVVVRRSENWKGREYDSCVLAAPVQIGNDAYCAIVVVNIHKYGEKRYYLHEVERLLDMKNAARGCCAPGAGVEGVTLRLDHSCLRLDNLHLDSERIIANAKSPVNGAKNAKGLRSGSSGSAPALSRTLGDIRSIAYSIFADNGIPENVFTAAVADVYDREGKAIGIKTLSAYGKNQYINAWISRFRQNEVGALGYMDGINGNDFQHNSIVYIVNSKSLLPNPRGIWINSRNIAEICVYFAVRHCVSADWLNDRDNFLVPSDKWSSDSVFCADSIIYTLFSDFNAIKSKFGVNHWIPFTEEEVGAKDCFKSHFMSDFLRASAPLCLCVKDISPVARAVLDAGRELWRYYHAQPDASPDASYYDIRLHFQGVKRTASGKEQMNPSSSDAEYTRLLAALRAAHKALAAQIAPKVYEYGFLKK